MWTIDEDKLTKVAKSGQYDLAVLLAHSKGWSTNMIAMTMIERDWRKDDRKEKPYELGDYWVFVSGGVLESNTHDHRYFFKDDEDRVEWFKTAMHNMIHKFLEERVDGYKRGETGKD